MLDQEMAAQLQQYLGMLRRPLTLTASLGNDAKSAELHTLLQQIASMSEHITLTVADNASSTTSAASDVRRPSFTIGRPDAQQHLRFAAIPLGHEFTSLVLALLWTGGHPPKVDAAIIERIQALPGSYRFEVFMSLSCQSCPEVVQALALMAVHNPRVQVTVIDGALFQPEVEARQIMAVPTVLLNGQHFANGRMGVEEILAKLNPDDATQQAAALQDKAPYDVLVIGGGPAGSAAAIYAARKGIRTGLLAERMGGQILDTQCIENLIAIPETDGPQLAAVLQNNVRQNGVDVLSGQQATALKPAAQAGGLAEVVLANGAVIKARTVVLATGARWREMNVPGEAQYKTRGIAFCTHCDGPLFKGKPVAVIGGGNSGVEAAIDLAGIVEHVTLLEYQPALKADAVLQQKLLTLPNVRVLTNSQVTEVMGDGQRVTGLRYTDRNTQAAHELPLAGVFVQIGLLPNTQWLAGAVTLNRAGEIEIDSRAATSAPGVFAAGDCTSVPYKQIVVAMGEGAKAALSAFDELIRHGGQN
ncbi:MAG: alkyl hydroperoxide reductase subunit F [Brachymonas sp.]|nr:alkyl hydroperoxide reductase subunit F [Brachymonas sp.]